MGEVYRGHRRRGGVTFEVDPPVFRGASCRRGHLAPMATAIGVDNGRSRRTGREPGTCRSSSHVTRRFCTPLSFRARRMIGLSLFCSAKLEDPQAFRRESHFVPEEKLSWRQCADGLPANQDGQT